MILKPALPIAIALALFSNVALAQLPQSQPQGLRSLQTTGFWSGYAIDGPYSSVSGTWQVPTVVSDGAGPSEYLYIYVGVGGHTDGTLIQIGSGELAPGSYFAWFELYPAGAQLIPHTIMPGDIVTASLTCVASCAPNVAQTWRLDMSNATANWNWSATMPYQSSMASAEWIAEAPGIPTYPLPNYNHFSMQDAVANGVNPGLTLVANGLVMQNPYGETSSPSETISGNSFSTCWGASGAALTPCVFTGFTGSPPTPTPSGPTVTFSASPGKIIAGQSSALTWASTHSTSCAGGGFSATGLSGSVSVTPSVLTNYTITCSDANGAYAQASAMVSIGACHGRRCR